MLEGTVAGDVVRSSTLAASVSWDHEAVLVGEWHQMALAWDAQVVRLYLDGGLLAHGKRVSAGMAASFARLYLGARFTGEYLANSQIAGLAVWPSRLAHSQILWRYLRDVRATTIPAQVTVSGADHIKVNRLALTAASTVPELNFHFVPQVSVEANGRFRVVFPWYFGGLLPNDPPGVPSVSLPAGVSGTVTCYRQPRLPQTDRCEIDLTAGTVATGQEVVLHLTKVALAGNVSLTHADGSNLNPLFLIDRGGATKEAGAFFATSTQPTLAVVASPSTARATVLVRAPSTVVVGQPFTLKVWPEKADGAPEFRTSLKLCLAGPPELSGLLPTLDITTNDDGSATVDGLTLSRLPATNPFVLTGTADGLAIDANPIQVVEATSKEPRLFWGDIHGHSSLSDGTIDPHEFMPFARSRALDFAAMTDHQCFGTPWGAPLENNQVDPVSWQTVQSLARQHYVPGAFVTFSAVELCGDRTVDPSGEGDWNVYFSRDDVPMLAADAILGPGGYLSKLMLADPQAIMIPHYGGRAADFSKLTVQENAAVPVVEIISNHTVAPDGAYGWAASQLNARPELRLGFVGSSDDHSGHPGRSMWWNRQGLLAAWADSLTREGVLAAIRARHTYAYSHGDRPIVRVTANHGAMMGDAVTLLAGEAPTLTIACSSACPATSVELYKSGALTWQAPAPTDPHDFSVTYSDPAMTSSSSYHFRVLFDGGAEAAWTSPVWFER